MRLLSLCAGALLLLGMSGCSSYRLGPTNGMPAGARSVEIKLFRNETQEPRLIEAIGTALRRGVHQDGTYRLDTHGDGDVLLDGVLLRYDRETLSFRPEDTLTVRDFRATLVAKVTATERPSGRVLFSKEVKGQTTIRFGSDLTSSERQAVPLLAEDLARNILSLLVEGSW